MSQQNSSKREQILLVVDMQNDFIDGVLGTPEAQAIVPKVVEKIKNWKGTIIATKDMHSKNTYFETQESEHVPYHCQIFSTGFNFNKSIRKALPFDADVIGKNKFGFKWPIDNDYQFADVTVVGLCTDTCVISNAIIIQTAGAHVTIDAACCAGSTPENHEAALKVMKALCMNIENWNN